jgi:hypothetical protein
VKPNCHHLCHHLFLSIFSSLSIYFYKTYFNFVTKVTRERVVFLFYISTLYHRFFKKTGLFMNDNIMLNYLKVLVTLLVTLG